MCGFQEVKAQLFSHFAAVKNKIRCCHDLVPGTLIILLSRDHFGRLRVALKQHICLNERSDSDRCNTCRRQNGVRAREMQETVKGESLFTHDRTSQLGLDVVRKAPPGPLRKTTAPLRWGPQPPHQEATDVTTFSGIWRWLDTLSMSGQQQLSPSGCGFIRQY